MKKIFAHIQKIIYTIFEHFYSPLGKQLKLIDYIEQTSLKFHIDRFINYNENETYIYLQYLINFKQNNSCFYIYIKNNLLPTNKNLSSFVIEKKSYNFELFLHLLEHTIKTLQEETT